MYKYKQTTDVEVGDLVVWTEIPTDVTNRINNKVYKVIGKLAGHSPIIIDETGSETMYGKGQGFKVLQTKPADQAVVGDYMYRIKYSTDTFPQHTVIKITEIGAKDLYYTSTRSVHPKGVIVIAQAESGAKYPYFEHIKLDGKTYVVKKEKRQDIVLTYSGVIDSICNNREWCPCDFTIQPDIDDIDWWQARFKAGLPVYVRDKRGSIDKCRSLLPKNWGKDYTFSMTDPSLVQQEQAPTIPETAISFALYPSGAPSEPTNTNKKGQTMDKTTLKLLLELLGASEEIKDATNSKFVGIITNEDEYVGYMYFDSKEDATECMAQPKMELHKLHLFEKSCILAQKPRKVIEIK